MRNTASETHDGGVRGAVARAIVGSVLRSAALPIGGLIAARAIHHVRFRQLNGMTLPQVVADLLGPMSGDDAGAIAREIFVNRLRTNALKAVRATAGDVSVQKWVQWPGVDVLRDRQERKAPAIFITWHFGPEVNLGAAFAGLGIPVTSFRSTPTRPEDTALVDYRRVADADERGLALRRGFSRLKNGGFVTVAIDGRQTGTALTVPFFGRRIQVGRGAAALARLTGAPLIPTAKVWMPDGRVQVRIFEPLALPALDPRRPDVWDEAVIVDAVKWFERFLHAVPEQFRMRNIVRLCAAPRIESATAPRQA
jgi:lauroyl/myristoyl acyltransferase